MIYTEMTEIAQLEKHPGMTIYACAYEHNDSFTNKRFSQKPVLGMLTKARTERLHKELMQKFTNNYAHYFVPFGKSGKLLWSKAVEIRNRKYADTEQECKDLYNNLVKNEIKFHEKLIDEIQKDLIN